MSRIQFKRDTTLAWETNNPLLADGEIGIDSDSQRFKLGDGSTRWNDLIYSSIRLQDDIASFLRTQNISNTVYDTFDNVSEIHYDIGCKEVYTYTSGEITKIDYYTTDGLTIVAYEEYTYDNSNRLLTQTTTRL